ncbi:MAG: phospholipase D-like domain-containing protein [Caldilineaceae bacterium]
MGGFRRTSGLLTVVCSSAFIILFVLLLGNSLATPLFSTAVSPLQNITPITPTLHLPLVQNATPRLLIAAAHIDSAISGEGDEALWLWNNGPFVASLAGWQITGNGHTATFPITSTLTVAPGAGLWCTADPTIFRHTFGFAPGCEWGADDDPAVLNLSGSTPRLTNSRGVIQLNSPDGQAVDVLVYGDEDGIPTGWKGAAAQLYTRGAIGAAGQVWRRKPGGADSFIDTDRATDWSGDIADLAWGRQTFFAGWRLWQPDWQPSVQPIQATGTLTLATGPDGLYEPVAAFLQSARSSLDLSLYTLEHPALAQEIAATAQRGVAVRLLLEGSVAGGISNLQRWCAAQIVNAGGQVYFLDARTDAPNGFRPRYRFLHAKYGIVDSTRAFVGTENLTPDSMPAPVNGSIPPGRRGFYLFTDAAAVTEKLARLFAYDWQPETFWDLRAYDPAKDGPPPGYTPPDMPPETLGPAPFQEPVTYTGNFTFALLASPEDSARPDNLLAKLMDRAKPGDEIRWVQLYEHKYWGDTFSNPVADPNPRLAGLIDAARRGGAVRVLLDSFFDEPSDDRSNKATAAYLRLVALAENLDIQAETANPTGAGIHAKAGTLAIGDERWVLVGSVNGGEISHKLNREVSLLVNAAPLYDRMVAVFQADWPVGGGE